MLSKKSVEDIDPSGKRVLVRVDFNVPLDNGKVVDDTRIRAALPTLNWLLERDCALILVSHLGRPKGTVVEELRLTDVARRLSELLGRPVQQAREVISDQVVALAASLGPGDVMMLENVRFDPREEANDPQFARELASLAELFVNDAFGVAHRAHASNVGVASYLPAVAGMLVKAELAALERLLDKPPRPFWAVIGGAKVSDKLGVLQGLLDVCDGLIIGGGMANTFLAAQGINMGGSLVEEDLFDEAQKLLSSAAERNVTVQLPVDFVVGREFSAGTEHAVVSSNEIPDQWLALDVGPASRQKFRGWLKDAGTIFWNGPLGVFEWEPFAHGTIEMARAVADSGAWSVVAGGDSVAAIHKAGVADRISHISTGGGASLKLLAGEPMPGIEVLLDARPGEGRQV